MGSMGTKSPIIADFKYWTSSENPGPTEVGSILDGSHHNVRRYPVELQDTRDSPIRFNLEDHGFQILKQDSALLPPRRNHDDAFDFTSGPRVREEYWPEICALLKEQLNVRSVLPLHDSVRTSSEDGKWKDYRDKDFRPKMVNGKRQLPTTGTPFHHVHCEFSPVGSRNAFRAVKTSFFDDNGCSGTFSSEEKKTFFDLRDEILAAEQQGIEASGCSSHEDWDGANYQGPRWAFFSIWRPLEAVERDPLAMLSADTLFTIPSDYTEKRKCYASSMLPHRDRPGMEDYIAVNMLPRPPPSGQQHTWYWTSNQQPNEIYAIKYFDSEAWKEGSRVVPCGPHSAFNLPDQHEKPARRSMETRCFAIW